MIKRHKHWRRIKRLFNTFETNKIRSVLINARIIANENYNQFNPRK